MILTAWHPDHMPLAGAVITLAIIALIGGGFAVVVCRTIGEAIGRRRRGRG